MTKLCSCGGCERTYYAKGYCRRHYHLHRRYGDATYQKRRPITFAGQTMSARQWALKLGLNPTSLLSRLANGWPLERALKTRRGVHGPKAIHK